MDSFKLNSIIVYCKVNNLFEIQYIEAIGELTPNIQNNLKLYCYKNKKNISVKQLIETATKHGYNEKQY